MNVDTNKDAGFAKFDTPPGAAQKSPLDANNTVTLRAVVEYANDNLLDEFQNRNTYDVMLGGISGLTITLDPAQECALTNVTATGTAGFQPSMSPTRAVHDLILTDAKADTPIGNCGLAKGDRIRAIDDVRFESPDDFRKKLRRAMVRQGDCLLTVVRDRKTVDLPVFFPVPK